MPETTWWGLPAAVVIIGLVEAAKQVGFPVRYAGVLAIVLGVLGGALAFGFADAEAAKSVALGLMAGCSASGLWSTSKNSAGK